MFKLSLGVGAVEALRSGFLAAPGDMSGRTDPTSEVVPGSCSDNCKEYIATLRARIKDLEENLLKEECVPDPPKLDVKQKPIDGFGTKGKKPQHEVIIIIECRLL